MGWLLLNLAMITGLGVAFYTLGGGAGNQGLHTLPLWAGAWLICLSYWFLPWVRLDPETIIENVVPSGALINGILDFTGLDTMVANITN